MLPPAPDFTRPLSRVVSIQEERERFVHEAFVDGAQTSGKAIKVPIHCGRVHYGLCVVAGEIFYDEAVRSAKSFMDLFFTSLW